MPKPYHFYHWDLFSRTLDGRQMQDKWENNDCNVCLYWPDLLALPLKNDLCGP